MAQGRVHAGMAAARGTVRQGCQGSCRGSGLGPVADGPDTRAHPGADRRPVPRARARRPDTLKQRTPGRTRVPERKPRAVAV
jgi:hypothetical protein